MKLLGAKTLAMLSPHLMFQQRPCGPYYFAAPHYRLYADTIRMEWAMYLGWYDPDKKKPLDKKLEDAIARYERKWEKSPVVALVNTDDFAGLTPRTDLAIRAAGHVARNVFFVGCDFEDDVVS